MLSVILIVIGLSVFETVSSLDNAIINAQVLSTMDKHARRWFLSYGVLIAVFLIRGLLPFLIIWISSPALGPMGALTASFSSDPEIHKRIESKAPVLLISGGTFLIFLFFHWLFLEPKRFGLPGEKFISSQGVWFYAVVSLFLTGMVWFALRQNTMLGFGAVIGSSVFFITNGFKAYAGQTEQKLLRGSAKSDIAKLLYLEIIDATFSIDGVLGAFAFTLAVPLIILGNGIGAIIVRSFTVKSIDTIKQYVYLKNGAMYSVFILGCVMLSDSFGIHIPEWFTPVLTILITGFFYFKSKSV
jgi:uncharacterized protein